jgi:hypothetical protein
MGLFRPVAGQLYFFLFRISVLELFWKASRKFPKALERPKTEALSRTAVIRALIVLIVRQSAWSVRLRLQAALRPSVVKMTFLWQGLLEFVRDRLVVQETKEAVNHLLATVVEIFDHSLKLKL